MLSAGANVVLHRQCCVVQIKGTQFLKLKLGTQTPTAPPVTLKLLASLNGATSSRQVFIFLTASPPPHHHQL